MKGKSVLLTKTYEQEIANHIRAVLEQNDISYKVVFSRNNAESALGMQRPLPSEFYIYEDDLEEAMKLIEGLDSSGEKEIDFDAFDDEELKEMILNPEQWHDNTVRQAKEIAIKRQLLISDDEVENYNMQKLIEIQKGKNPNIIVYYLMWFFAFGGGIIGLIAGWVYWLSKQTAFDGNEYYVYNIRTRTYGELMFFLALLSLIVQLLLLFAVVINQ